MYLFFEADDGSRRLIGLPETNEEAHQLITDFLNDHNFKSYYRREWKENGELYIDVGSHTEFFVLVT